MVDSRDDEDLFGDLGSIEDDIENADQPPLDESVIVVRVEEEPMNEGATAKDKMANILNKRRKASGKPIRTSNQDLADDDLFGNIGSLQEDLENADQPPLDDFDYPAAKSQNSNSEQPVSTQPEAVVSQPVAADPSKEKLKAILAGRKEKKKVVVEDDLFGTMDDLESLNLDG